MNRATLRGGKIYFSPFKGEIERGMGRRYTKKPEDRPILRPLFS